MASQPDSAEWTVPGLTHRKKGEYRERVETKSGGFGLVHSELDLEIIEFVIKKGERFTIFPYDDPREAGTESILIQNGRFVADAVTAPLVVGPGDFLVTKSLSETITFVAEEETTFLSFTARPTFHQLSTEMSDLMRMAVAVEEKDGYTGEHCLRLQKYSVAMGRVLGLGHGRLYLLDIGAYLHDLGKVKVPQEILGKSGPLTNDEWNVMKQHPTWGRELLQGTFLEMAGPILEQHHERLDGSGYPNGLKGDEVWLEASIVAVADTYDAITTDRPYRKGATPGEAIEELRKFVPSHYPAAVVDALEQVLRKDKTID